MYRIYRDIEWYHGIFLSLEESKMIFVTGDTHGDFSWRFNEFAFEEQKEMTKADYVIICGDFGGVWSTDGETEEEKKWLDKFEQSNFTLLFVDGNHENFDRLNKYTEKIWNGGKVHELRPSVLHLMRGQVFEIDGRKIFTFGGARSHDISGGILDPTAEDYEEQYKAACQGTYPFRIKNVSWWDEEMPCAREMIEGKENLAKHNNKVDFIITHCCASSTQALFSQGLYKPDELTAYLEEVKQSTEFKKWFFGHYHDNRNVSDKEIMIWEQMIRIN